MLPFANDTVPPNSLVATTPENVSVCALGPVISDGGPATSPARKNELGFVSVPSSIIVNDFGVVIGASFLSRTVTVTVRVTLNGSARSPVTPLSVNVNANVSTPLKSARGV